VILAHRGEGLKSAGQQGQVEEGLFGFYQAGDLESQRIPGGGDPAEGCSGGDQLLQQEVRLVILTNGRFSIVHQP